MTHGKFSNIFIFKSNTMQNKHLEKLPIQRISEKISNILIFLVLKLKRKILISSKNIINIFFKQVATKICIYIIKLCNCQEKFVLYIFLKSDVNHHKKRHQTNNLHLQTLFQKH